MKKIKIRRVWSPDASPTVLIDDDEYVVGAMCADREPHGLGTDFYIYVAKPWHDPTGGSA